MAGVIGEGEGERGRREKWGGLGEGRGERELPNPPSCFPASLTFPPLPWLCRPHRLIWDPYRHFPTMIWHKPMLRLDSCTTLYVACNICAIPHLLVFHCWQDLFDSHNKLYQQIVIHQNTGSLSCLICLPFSWTGKGSLSSKLWSHFLCLKEISHFSNKLRNAILMI